MNGKDLVTRLDNLVKLVETGKIQLEGGCIHLKKDEWLLLKSTNPEGLMATKQIKGYRGYKIVIEG